MLKLLEELEKMDPNKLLEIEEEVGPDDKVVGELTDVQLKKLKTLSNDKIDAFNALVSQMNAGDAQPDIVEMRRRKFEIDILQSLFWHEINESFGLWNETRIGIRNGWKVVTFARQKSNPSDIFGMMLGG